MKQAFLMGLLIDEMGNICLYYIIGLSYFFAHENLTGYNNSISKYTLLKPKM
jgi:hypothetical protein